MRKIRTYIYVVLVLVFILSGMPIQLVFAQDSCACACCKGTCDSKIMTCQSSCNLLFSLEKNNFLPDLPLVGAFINNFLFTYKHDHICTVFHPPNAADAFVS